MAVIGGGLLYDALADWAEEPVQSPAEAIFIILTAAFLQPSSSFPRHYSLQLFHFLMPVVGIIILAQGLVDFGSLLFNGRARNKEWEMAVASTMNHHIVLVGLGHLGYRVAQRLNEMGKNVVDTGPCVTALTGNHMDPDREIPARTTPEEEVGK